MVKQEIERAEVWQFEALDITEADALKVPLYAIGCHFADEDGIVVRMTRDQTYVGGIAFIT